MLGGEGRRPYRPRARPRASRAGALGGRGRGPISCQRASPRVAHPARPAPPVGRGRILVGPAPFGILALRSDVRARRTDPRDGPHVSGRAPPPADSTRPRACASCFPHGRRRASGEPGATGPNAARPACAAAARGPPADDLRRGPIGPPRLDRATATWPLATSEGAWRPKTPKPQNPKTPKPQ